MAKIVKIPLVMKNGEKATDMNSLIANFDVESVVGYFLDGKLEKWLNDRYYEDEANAVGRISKNDPLRVKKLCEIFGIAYEADMEIDAEEIARRNERIARLKQITDDESVWTVIDSVAFGQEELAELYDRGLQKIYLCEGEFRIPKSKQGLDYQLIGSAIVTGLHEKSTAVARDEFHVPYASEEMPIVTIAEHIADKIAENPDAVLDDYEATLIRQVAGMTGLELFKLSPKKNCKECGSPTCMAFCSKVAVNNEDILRCPYWQNQSKTEAHKMNDAQCNQGNNATSKDTLRHLLSSKADAVFDGGICCSNKAERIQYLKNAKTHICKDECECDDIVALFPYSQGTSGLALTVDGIYLVCEWHENTSKTPIAIRYKDILRTNYHNEKFWGQQQVWLEVFTSSGKEYDISFADNFPSKKKLQEFVEYAVSLVKHEA